MIVYAGNRFYYSQNSIVDVAQNPNQEWRREGGVSGSKGSDTLTTEGRFYTIPLYHTGWLWNPLTIQPRRRRTLHGRGDPKNWYRHLIVIHILFEAARCRRKGAVRSGIRSSD